MHDWTPPRPWPDGNAPLPGDPVTLPKTLRANDSGYPRRSDWQARARWILFLAGASVLAGVLQYAAWRAGWLTGGDLLADTWTTKLGSTKPLLLGTYVSGTLTTVSDPKLWVRRPEQDPDDAQEFTLEVYADPSTPAAYNLERQWTAEQLASLGAGRFIAEVRGTIGGKAVAFPDRGYIELRVMPGVP